MYSVEFRKEYAEQLRVALASGGTITPPGGAWTVYAMMQVAGACLFGVMSHGPIRPGHPGSHLLPPEHREAVEMDFAADLRAAIEFCNQLTMLVVDGEYDDQFEAVVAVGVEAGPSGPQVAPIHGWEGH